MSEFKFTLIDKAEVPPSEKNGCSKYKDIVKILLENQKKSIRMPVTSKAKAQTLRATMRSGIGSMLNKKERGRWKVCTRIRDSAVFIWIEEIATIEWS